MTNPIKPCPFCDKSQEYRYITESAHLRVIYPKAAACNYHVLIVPKRHVAQVDSLNAQEAAEVFVLVNALVSQAKQNIPGFVGYNILSNNGGAAVQQHVQHAHVHVFLRTNYDTTDPLRPGDTNRPPDLSPEQAKNMQYLQILFSGKV